MTTALCLVRSTSTAEQDQETDQCPASESALAPVPDPTREPVLGECITIVLIPKVEDELRRLQDRTGMSRTDLTNRAITLYEFVDHQLKSGRQVISRDASTGELELIQFLDGHQGQAAAVDRASTQRGRHRRSGHLWPRILFLGKVPWRWAALTEAAENGGVS